MASFCRSWIGKNLLVLAAPMPSAMCWILEVLLWNDVMWFAGKDWVLAIVLSFLSSSCEWVRYKTLLSTILYAVPYFLKGAPLCPDVFFLCDCCSWFCFLPSGFLVCLHLSLVPTLYLIAKWVMASCQSCTILGSLDKYHYPVMPSNTSNGVPIGHYFHLKCPTLKAQKCT